MSTPAGEQNTGTGSPSEGGGLSAWLGFTTKPVHGRKCVRICADCPDKRAAEIKAIAEGYEMTHTYCDRCAYRRNARLLGENPDD